MALLGGWRITRVGLLFIVGILVLGGLVTGGIFIVKNHGEAVRHDQAVKIAEQNLKDQSQMPVATEPAKNSSDSDHTSATGTGTTGTSTATVTTTNTSVLPVTGINDLQVFGSSVILAILAFSVVSYAASKRAADRL